MIFEAYLYFAVQKPVNRSAVGVSVRVPSDEAVRRRSLDYCSCGDRRHCGLRPGVSIRANARTAQQTRPAQLQGVRIFI